ncbi:unnamed protein product [Rotaria sp. Silwood2]|nr:unnamed protein product [Rotaria sp. Silwood2]CAF3949607.1 unnamed protein product [Rotaria sp. Silwood2]CAF4497538.1 unnamed protein product [Rotaria sp. Silwood2]
MEKYPLTDNHHIEKSREELIRVENLFKSASSSRLFEFECLLAKLYHAQSKLLFIPRDVDEEILLLLLLFCETSTLNETVLD